jgi:hypothetical protein
VSQGGRAAEGRLCQKLERGHTQPRARVRGPTHRLARLGPLAPKKATTSCASRDGLASAAGSRHASSAGTARAAGRLGRGLRGAGRVAAAGAGRAVGVSREVEGAGRETGRGAILAAGGIRGSFGTLLAVGKPEGW